ncbi:MAG: hypothetical protein IT165_37010 [Bryobacterales bacterium]|nr:hypothetical protein [Bryobacterales bacterium]
MRAASPTRPVARIISPTLFFPLLTFASPPETKTILDLQPFRQSSSIFIRTAAGREGAATLVNLNPAINVWHLLRLKWNDAATESAYHIENPEPRVRKLLLDEKFPLGILVLEAGKTYPCELFPTALDQAKASSRIYAPLCGGKIYLRNPATGNRTTLEAATEFLRERVWGGEKLISIGHILLGGMHRETGKLEPAASPLPDAAPGSPLPALVDPKFKDRLLSPGNLGIVVENPAGGGMRPGAWYPALANPGIFAGLLQPDLLDPAILSSYRTTVNHLDNVEASALCYLIAFDLDRFDFAYSRGTAHPRVGWSDHMLPQMKDPKLPGPDGIGSIAPLVSTGLISPEAVPKTAAAFTAGFKRAHGAFKYGELALRNHGSHYGSLENGVVFSKLQPGLATIFILDNGSFAMKTWTDADNQLLPRIRYALQNGVSLIEFDNAARRGIPGPLVARWGPGNWSGSQDSKLRTLRAGAALQTSGGKRFFLYAVFSDATPSAMARVFQAYRADYAMLLDMNALEHTYLAVYRRSGGQLFLDHLVKGMAAVEKTSSGELVPRFAGYPDNRDFFYVTRRGRKEQTP